MKDMPSQTFIVAADNQSPLAQAIREVAGIEGEFEVTTPQFTRPRWIPMPGQPPETLQDWEDLKTLSVDDLRSLGFGHWEDGLCLIPGEWYTRLIPGLMVESTSGRKITVAPDYQNEDSESYLDNDIRYGCLAYGIRAQGG